MSAIGQLSEDEKKEMREKLMEQRMYRQNKHSIRYAQTNLSRENMNARMATDTFGRENDSRNCSFLIKTGACMHGETCARFHPWPESSRTLIFQNMYDGPGLVVIRSAFNDDDIEEGDVGENEIYASFIEFWDDVIPELEKFGEIEELRVCRNNSPHLRGNVLVMYKEESAAVKAQAAMNGRYYAEKPISSATCASFCRGGCERSWDCNFLHVFINPGRKYYSWGPIDRTGRYGRPRPYDKDTRGYRRGGRHSRRSPSPRRRRSPRRDSYRRDDRRRDDRYRDRRDRDYDRRDDRRRDRDGDRDRDRDRDGDRDRNRDRDRDRDREGRDRDRERDRDRDRERRRDRERDRSRGDDRKRDRPASPAPSSTTTETSNTKPDTEEPSPKSAQDTAPAPEVKENAADEAEYDPFADPLESLEPATKKNFESAFAGLASPMRPGEAAK